MNWQVVVQRLAREDLLDAYRYVSRRAPVTARKWLDRFEEALRTLAIHPLRCPLARENGKVELEVHEFHFGRRPYTFRVVFALDGKMVRILRIRRAQRRALSRSEIERALIVDDLPDQHNEEQ